MPAAEEIKLIAGPIVMGHGILRPNGWSVFVIPAQFGTPLKMPVFQHLLIALVMPILKPDGILPPINIYVIVNKDLNGILQELPAYPKIPYRIVMPTIRIHMLPGTMPATNIYVIATLAMFGMQQGPSASRVGASKMSRW